MRRVTTLVAALTLLLGSLHLRKGRRPESPGGLGVNLVKLLAEGLAPILAVAGAASSLVGLILRAPLAVLMGAAGALLSGWYTAAVATAPGDLAGAFGADWEKRIPAERPGRMLRRRWTPLAPRPPEVRHLRDIAFAIVPLPPGGPAGDRPIYCDLWLPPEGLHPTGLGLIYLHGSAWLFGDKDRATRTFFRHLTAQGYVIMDVGYRMAPETDVRGMAADAKRAIAWLKEHATEYGIDPNCIVISGGSAGGHLALLAGYTPAEPALCPAELAGRDLSVRAVVAYYPPSDFSAMDEYYGWQKRMPAGEPPVIEGPLVPPGPGASRGEQRDFLRLQWQRLDLLPYLMFGGYPQEVPEMYRLASPRSHIGPHCPPTLLIQGEHDILVPVASVRALAETLREAGVPVDYYELPATEHAFDLAFPRIAPAAQAALYEVERFLALVCR